MVKVKVRRGTVQSHQSLCLSCRHSQVRISGGGRTTVKCSYDDRYAVVKERIVECSTYSNKATPELYDSERIAWTLQTDKNRGPLGFQPPKINSYGEVEGIKSL